MYSSIQIITLAFIIGLTGALAPGPTLVATINSSLKGGWTVGPKVSIGHAAVEVVVFGIILMGFNAAVQSYSSVVSIVGGIALILFGAITIKGSKNASLAKPSSERASNPYLAGALTSAANPYFWIWWLSIGSAMVIDGLRGGILMGALFMIGHWGADFGWYTLVSTSIDKGRSILSEKSYKIVLTSCGVFLMLFGFYYLASV